MRLDCNTRAFCVYNDSILADSTIRKATYRLNACYAQRDRVPSAQIIL